MSTNFTLQTMGAEFAKRFPKVTWAVFPAVWFLALVMTFSVLRAGFFYGSLGQDAHAYWLAGQGELVYNRQPGQADAYLYSPVFLTLISPLTMLPWQLFLPLWICLEAALLAWLLKPLPIKWAIPVFLLCTSEIVVGNIYIFLAGAAVLGLRKPAAWAFPILTKVTAGVGLLWFAARGDWRGLLQGIGGLSLIVIVSYVVNPAQWHAWLQFLIEHREGTPDSQISFLLRCLLAITLVVFGARTQQPWLVAPAMVLASPVLVGFIPLTMLAAIPRLARLPRRDEKRSGSRLPGEAENSTKAQPAGTP